MDWLSLNSAANTRLGFTWLWSPCSAPTFTKPFRPSS